MMRQARLIIYDEAPMQHGKFALEAIDRTLQDIKDNDSPFSGIPTVFGGDFKQILPVIPRGSREDVVSASLQRSHLWQKLHILKLHQNMHLGLDDSERWFASWLLDVGNGKDISPIDGTISLPDHTKISTYDSLLSYVYGDIQPNAISVPAPEYFLDRAILAP